MLGSIPSSARRPSPSKSSALDQAWKAKTAVRHTLGHLILEYQEDSGVPAAEADHERGDYERVLAMFERAHGMPLSAITRAQGLYLAQSGLRQAQAPVRELRGAGAVAHAGDRREPRAGRDQRRAARREDPQGDRGGASEPALVGGGARCRAVAAPIQLKAPLAFMRYLGARLGDVRAMPTAAYQDGMIIFRTGKGDVEVCVPCPVPLAAILEQRLPSRTHLFVTSEGTPWTDGGWNASWRKLRARLEEAGEVRPGLTAHGLRHSVATDLRELGKTDREIADILGQRTTYATPTYHRSADMKRSNARVMGDLHGDDRSEEKSNPVANLPS